MRRGGSSTLAHAVCGRGAASITVLLLLFTGSAALAATSAIDSPAPGAADAGYQTTSPRMNLHTRTPAWYTLGGQHSIEVWGSGPASYFQCGIPARALGGSSIFPAVEANVSAASGEGLQAGNSLILAVPPPLMTTATAAKRSPKAPYRFVSHRQASFEGVESADYACPSSYPVCCYRDVDLYGSAIPADKLEAVRQLPASAPVSSAPPGRLRCCPFMMRCNGTTGLCDSLPDDYFLHRVDVAALSAPTTGSVVLNVIAEPISVAPGAWVHFTWLEAILILFLFLFAVPMCAFFALFGLAMFIAYWLVWYATAQARREELELLRAQREEEEAAYDAASAQVVSSVQERAFLVEVAAQSLRRAVTPHDTAEAPCPAASCTVGSGGLSKHSGPVLRPSASVVSVACAKRASPPGTDCRAPDVASPVGARAAVSVTRRLPVAPSPSSAASCSVGTSQLAGAGRQYRMTWSTPASAAVEMLPLRRCGTKAFRPLDRSPTAAGNSYEAETVEQNSAKSPLAQACAACIRVVEATPLDDAVPLGAMRDARFADTSSAAPRCDARKVGLLSPCRPSPNEAGTRRRKWPPMRGPAASAEADERLATPPPGSAGSGRAVLLAHQALPRVRSEGDRSVRIVSSPRISLTGLRVPPQPPVHSLAAVVRGGFDRGAATQQRADGAGAAVPAPHTASPVPPGAGQLLLTESATADPVVPRVANGTGCRAGLGAPNQRAHSVALAGAPEATSGAQAHAGAHRWTHLFHSVNSKSVAAMVESAAVVIVAAACDLTGPLASPGHERLTATRASHTASATSIEDVDDEPAPPRRTRAGRLTGGGSASVGTPQSVRAERSLSGVLARYSRAALEAARDSAEAEETGAVDADRTAGGALVVPTSPSLDTAADADEEVQVAYARGSSLAARAVRAMRSATAFVAGATLAGHGRSGAVGSCYPRPLPTNDSIGDGRGPADTQHNFHSPRQAPVDAQPQPVCGTAPDDDEGATHARPVAAPATTHVIPVGDAGADDGAAADVEALLLPPCAVCSAAPARSLSMPCGHLTFCPTCAKQMRHCGACGQIIKRRLKIFVV